nr:16S rRNA (cytidine(1402)-2'-O)-methyltransferase [Lachnospiraceae bacterium]
MSCGTLYICATPIGNREDISARAVRVLQEADLIAAEDTRHSKGLLDYYGISKPLVSYHEHNKYERAEELVGRLLQGENIALISDAGTPVISDPGEVLVIMAREAGIPVTSLPGPCALITALTLSGISARRFVFEGFLPMESKDRKAVLDSLREEERTIVLYEAPHRLRRTLQELKECLGGARPACLCRELTKIHEEALPLTLEEAEALYQEKEPRGEYVLVIAGKSRRDKEEEMRNTWESCSPEEHLQAYMNKGMTKKEAIKAMAEDFAISRNTLYALLMK